MSLCWDTFAMRRSTRELACICECVSAIRITENGENIQYLTLYINREINKTKQPHLISLWINLNALRKGRNEIEMIF